MEGFAEVTEELINEYLSFFGKNHVFSDAERTLLNRNWTRLMVRKNEQVVAGGGGKHSSGWKKACFVSG